MISQLSFLGIGMKNLEIRVATAETQKSIEQGAMNLIDKDTSTFYLSAGNAPSNTWVQLELATVGTVHNIKITNRLECCGKLLSDIEVRVGDYKVTIENSGMPNHTIPNTVCGTYDGPGSYGETVTIQCSKPVKGRYVTVQTLARVPKILNIAEVEVFE